MKIAIKNSFSILIYIFIVLLIVKRAQYGVDFSDESWYVAEPHIVYKGAIPLVNNWTQAPGFTLPLFVPFGIYEMFRGGTEGIILFSRYLFIVWEVVILGITAYIFKSNRGLLLPSLFGMVLVGANSLLDINYNTIGLVYLIFIVALLYKTLISGKYIYAVLAGVIMARTVIGSPYTIVAAVIISVGLVCWTVKTRNLKCLFCWVLGGIITGLLVFAFCIYRSGFIRFIEGIHYLFQNLAYSKIHIAGRSIKGDALKIIGVMKYCVIITGTCIIIRVACYIKNVHFELIKNCVFIILLIIEIITAILAIKSGYHFMLIRLNWYVAVAVAIIVDKKNENAVIIYFLAGITVLYVAVYVMAIFANIYGAGSDREYWLIIPTMLGIYSIALAMERKWKINLLILLLTVIYSFVGVIGLYQFVYRDGPVKSLYKEVESGIWKGIYTTEERAKNVVDLETILRNKTTSRDKVLFLDWNSYAYLMTDAEACSPTTLDPMLYTYQVNDDTVMYDYFATSGKKPTKIIYINYGRDEMVSINDDNWQFNRFVKEKYEQIDNYTIGAREETTSGEKIEVIVYELCRIQ